MIVAFLNHLGKLLGPRRSSVFPAPIREVLRATTYEEANLNSKRLTGKGLSKQTFGIIPKIIEVNNFLQSNSNARNLVRESHPEMCFLSLANGFPMQYNKKTQEGFMERLEILTKFWKPTGQAITQAYFLCHKFDVALDDIVDALVLAIVASHPDSELVSIPQQPRIDHKGLPIEMVYLSYTR